MADPQILAVNAVEHSRMIKPSQNPSDILPVRLGKASSALQMLRDPPRKCRGKNMGLSISSSLIEVIMGSMEHGICSPGQRKTRGLHGHGLVTRREG